VQGSSVVHSPSDDEEHSDCHENRCDGRLKLTT